MEYLFKNYVIFWGGGGEVIKRLHWIKGGGGRSKESKKGLRNFSMVPNSKIHYDDTASKLRRFSLLTGWGKKEHEDEVKTTGTAIRPHLTQKTV